MKKKFIIALLLTSIAVFSFGCSKDKSSNAESKIDLLENAKANISLSDTITVDGSGVVIEDNIITIKEAGIYGVSGTLKDGQIVIDAGDEENVELVLNGVNITNSKSSPIYVANAKNTYLILNDGTENVVTDGSDYIFEDEAQDEPSAAIFSKDDLFIDGSGSLVVNGNYRNGIASKDDLEVLNGNINVTAKEDGLRGKDSLTITNGNITINSGADGIKANNDTEAEKGYVLIEGGVLNITSGEDGIQGETLVTINNGEININSGGGSANVSTENTEGTEEISKKGIKAGVNIVVENGKVNIDSLEDSLHSNGDITINSGEFSITSGDDGIHADNTVNVNNGVIKITKSYEGMEGKTININDGDIEIISSDDGINISDPNSDSTAKVGFGTVIDGALNINGGRVIVNASADGLDSNGSINMTGGLVIVNGPESGGDGAIDYDGDFQISGGTLVASGSSEMAQMPGTTSTQNSIGIFLTEAQEANTLVSIKDSQGNEVITFSPSKTFQSVIISSANIMTGETYTAYVGGSSSSNENNGLYEIGSYTGGVEEGSVTISSSVSTIGSGGMMMPGGGGTRPGGMTKPEGGMQNGQRPEIPEGMERPEGMQNGERPEMPQGMEIPEGEIPQG